MHDVIVIGGGPAGVTAALRARELGATVALVERGRLGGTCTNDGCVPTRVLAKAARLLRLSYLLQQGLRVLSRHQLIEILRQRPPLRTECDRQHNGEPNRGDECTPPQWPLKPRNIASAASQIATFAQ